MSSVDDRIVNMQFNNKQFVQGAAETQRSLDGVERAIGKAGSSKGFTSMGSAVDGIKGKFSAMQVVGVTALATITNKAVNAGINLVKSLTLDPIMDGFSEYQTNLNSIQTVIANTGESVGTVNQYMNKLNAYSDQTIYNFSEMAKNIGTFTAAGVDLKTSTAAIQGISNIAALSGSSSQQASTAMYQLSQSIASGRVGLQDWNSVVNAGMGGKNFQTALATTASAMGDISKGSLEVGDKVKIAGKSFRESISGGDSWLSSDTLVKTLELMDGRLSIAALKAGDLSDAEAELALKQEQAKLATEGYSKAQIESLTKMADAAYSSATVIKTFPQLMQVTKESIGSIFAQSFSLIIGNFEQSKALWTKVGSYIIGPTGFINKMGSAWTGMLSRWANDGGRDKVIRSFGRIFSTLGKVMGAFGDAFKDVFPPDSKQILMQITRLFTHFTKNLVIGEDTVDSLRSIFGGLFAILHIGMTIFKAVASAAMAFFGAIMGPSKDAGGGILSVVASVGEMIKAFDRFLTQGDSINKVFSAFGTTVGLALMPVLKIIGLIGSAIGSLATGGGISGFLAPFKEAKGEFANFLSIILGGLSQITAPFSVLSGFFSDMQAKINAIRDSFAGVGDSAQAAVGSIASGAGGAASGALDKVGSGIDSVKTNAEGLKGSVESMFAGFNGPDASAAQESTSRLSETGTELKGRWEAVSGVMNSLGEGIRSIFQKIADVAGAIKDEFQQLFGGMDALDWANVLNSLFTGALLLNISRFVSNTDGLFTGLSKSLFGTSQAISGSFGQLTDTLKTMQTQVKSQIVKNIAIAVALMAGSIIALSFIKPAKIGIATGAIATMMGILITTFKVLDKLEGDKELAMISLGIVLISAAMVNLALAIKLLGGMDLASLSKGIGAMALALGIIVGEVKGMSGIEGSLASAGAAIYIIASAMVVLSAAIFAFGSMKISTLAKGLGTMAIGLGLITGALNRLGTLGPDALAAAGAIFIVSAAMVVMAAAIGALGKMKISTLAKGIGAFAAIMIIMGVAMSVISAGGPEALMGAGAILILAGAMQVMTTVILALGATPFGVVAKGIMFLALALGVILLAGAAAMVVAPGLMALGIAVGLLGLALALAGAGMFLFATGFAIFAAAGVAGVAVLTAGFTAFMALLPSLAVQVGASVVAFVETIAKMSPRLRAAFGEIFKNILGTIEDAIPEIAKLLILLVHTAIAVIENTIPDWIEMGFTLIDEFLTSMGKHIPDIAKKAGDLIVDFIDAIDDDLQNIIDAGTDLIVNFLLGLSRAGVEIANATGMAILTLLNGIDAAIVKYQDDIYDAGARIAKHIMEGLSDHFNPYSLIKSRTTQSFDDVKAEAEANAAAKKKGEESNERTVTMMLDPTGTATRLANALVARGDSSVNTALTSAQNKQRAAAAAQAQADAAADAAAKLEKKYNKGKKSPTKKQQNKIDAAQKVADNKSNSASAASDSADDASSAVDAAIAFRDADAAARGDILKQAASDSAAVANQKFARAQELQRLAEAARAAKDDKKAKDLERKATLALTDARNASTAAEQQAKDAVAYYAISVNNRIADIEKSYQADLDKRAAEKAYNEADDAGKLAILNTRKANDQAAAEAAQREYARLIAQAKQQATTDAEAANVTLDQAAAQAALASQYLDALATDTQNIESLTGSLSNASNGGSLSPSRTAMEDAAKAVDRYTESLAEATELASVPSGPVQFIQNNTSPVALSPIDTYRLGKNLVSSYETKMGA